MSAVQSVIFFNDQRTPEEELEWLKHHHFSPIKSGHVITHGDKVHSVRYRIREPEDFDHFITKRIEPDIDLIIGFYNPKPAYLK
jgi:hypothetical protein